MSELEDIKKALEIAQNTVNKASAWEYEVNYQRINTNRVLDKNYKLLKLVDWVKENLRLENYGDELKEILEEINE